MSGWTRSLSSPSWEVSGDSRRCDPVGRSVKELLTHADDLHASSGYSSSMA